MEYQLYQAPQTQEILSVPITLIDGTSSMNREYKYIIQTYEQEFGDLQENQRRQFQWSYDLHDIYPYLNETRGNLTTVMAQLFKFMLSTTQFPFQYVTIILVSDGREQFDINAIMELCQLIKSRYSVQFLCISIGNQFPKNIIQSLKQNIENQDYTYNPLYQITRSDHQSYLQIQQELKLAFQYIRKLLAITPQYHQLCFDIYTSISTKQSQKYVASNELFLAQADQKIIIQNQQLVKCDDPNLILQFFRKSIENTFQRYELLQINEIIDEFKSTFTLLHKLNIGITQSEENSQQLELIQLILKVLEKIATSSPQDEALYQYIQQFKIRINSENPENIQELLEQPKSDNLEDQINKLQLQIQRSFENLFNLNSQNKQKISFDCFEEFRKIFTNCIKKFCELFENFQEQKMTEIQVLMTSFITYTEAFFSSEIFNISTIEQFQFLINVNEQFQILNSLKTEINIIKFKNIMENFKKMDFEINHQIDPYIQLNQLPQNNKKNDEILSEKFLIFLIDKNETLKTYSDSLLKCYLEIFSKVPPKKRLEINWHNNPTNNFKIISNQEFEKLQYESFKELLDFLQDKLKLKNKLIHLIILTDSEQYYEKLHLQIRFAQMSQYSFKIIYISIGIKIQTYLENYMFKIRQSLKNNYQLIKNIPKQLITQDQKPIGEEQSKQIRKNHIRIIQEIATHIDAANF
ncbi:unnamed protein product [Paramecium sonneborni]|uniref:Uncharacterized protein n=1 Tax=Paramecium sonneborni TaxID=65129 RepID=A0A8S1KVA7_9CILI|nr:unnamed protein product [Paramecium sonneborni]